MEKAYENFIVPIELVVQSVVGYTSSTSFTPQSEMVFGGRSPVYRGGQSSNLEITVGHHPIVKKIFFAGLPPIEKGDKIRAYVFKAEKHTDIFGRSANLRKMIHNIASLPIEERVPPKYVARDFKAEESALKIEKLRREVISNKVEGDYSIYLVVATYVDVDLSKF